MQEQMNAHMLKRLLSAYAHAVDTNKYFPSMLLENARDTAHAAPAEQTRYKKMGGGWLLEGISLNRP